MTRIYAEMLVERPVLQGVIEQLQTVGEHVLGVVLNEMNPHSRKYGYYYHLYYSKYSNYYDAPGDRRTKGTKRLLRKKAVENKS
jgi:Mrp family chromosome partitioning ATPase